MKNKIIIYSLFIGMLLLLVSCQKAESPTVTPTETENNTNEEMNIDDSEENTSEESSSGTGVKTTFPKDEDITKEVTPEATNVKTFAITAKQWDFVPNEVVVNKWDTVKLEITSTDVEHGINIPEYNISKTLSPWQKTVIEFVADKEGTFSFFCNVFCGTGHRDMKWTLIVK